MGVEKFHYLAAKFEGTDAYSYMDFCCDGNVTLDVTAICCGFYGVISYMDFCCDGNVTRDVTVTMDGGDDF